MDKSSLAAAGTALSGHPGRLRRTLHRLAADKRQLQAEELQDEVRSCGATALSGCQPGTLVRAAGTLETVTIRPREGQPTLEAELYDGSAFVTLVWLGRRSIAGIEPGRNLVVSGRLANCDGRTVLFNPRYELRSES